MGKNLRITFIIGHDRMKEGATNCNGETEYAYWSRILSPFRKMDNIFVITRNNGGKTGAYNFAEEINSDFTLEMHFNAFDKKTSGCECLYNLNSNFELATVINQVAVDTLGSKDRGIVKVQNGDRGFHNLKGRERAIICEPFFGDNASDMPDDKDVKFYILEIISVLNRRFRR